ncbi:translation initiation factor IF-3 [Heliobacillus mobilis]|uniref:Translation initiation factor IF-3 n=1 Tax=Heliobacterium mobile TaxID=28064 RepID=A0A6I3SPG1_HELMO|nr:translation initiation factor IF-3 [Heliobacterium mobile]MTV50402.1 translation initiation factor IF-3 [Heliobacterium mobile]
MSKDLRINEEIRVREVRLVGTDGEQLGILAVRDALRMAQERNLGLVEVAPMAKPPVCRIMDYGKYKFEQSKREREARKKQKIVNIKEVKLRPNIEDNDFDTKARNAIRFLEDGDKVKVTIMFRGREITHPELGRQLCVRLAEVCKPISNVERDAKVEGRNMIMILTPKAETQREPKAEKPRDAKTAEKAEAPAKGEVSE